MTREGNIRLVLLAEDKRSATFVRKVIVKLNIGATDRTIRERIAPKAKGSGKAWVDQEFIIEQAVYRSKKHQENLGLFVVTDADNESVAQRKQKLHAGTNRGSKEKICLLISKWSIETWLLHFRRFNVSEAKTLKKKYENEIKDKRFNQDVDQFLGEYRKHQKGEEFQTLPSLEEAYRELSNIVALL